MHDFYSVNPINIKKKEMPCKIGFHARKYQKGFHVNVMYISLLQQFRSVIRCRVVVFSEPSRRERADLSEVVDT